MQNQSPHIGSYCNGTPKVAMFTILLPDGTCGMFMMPSAQDVFYLGFTEYAIVGNELGFKVQNPNMEKTEKPAKINSDDVVKATLTPGVEYIQHGTREQGDSKFLFLSPDISYWMGIGGFKALGEARQLEGMQDFDHAHEIKKLSVKIIERFGSVFVWA